MIGITEMAAAIVMVVVIEMADMFDMFDMIGMSSPLLHPDGRKINKIKATAKTGMITMTKMSRKIAGSVVVATIGMLAMLLMVAMVVMSRNIEVIGMISLLRAAGKMATVKMAVAIRMFVVTSMIGNFRIT